MPAKVPVRWIRIGKAAHDRQGSRLDLPGIDIALIARGYGCTAVDVSTPEAAREAFREALDRFGPSVIVAAIDPSVPDLL